MQKPLSRLEKFLYALCSLDSSELPNPLSRLEVLLKCLVTGETPPAFEPLSRNEKYLMTILGSYHDELPNPISRGEKLLYKLATGDDNIDDIGEALSRYEELLTYMIGNGCLDGSIDVEYVTYVLTSGQNTLYNTKELPLKSAILKGNTLVNLTCHGRQLQGASDDNLTEGRLTWTTNAEWQRVYFPVNGKPNTKYIIKYQSINENVEIYYRLDTTNINQGGAQGIWISNQTFTSGETGTFIVSLEAATASSDLWVQDFMIIEYQEGMENWDIPYFEGIGSVENPVVTTIGKNLFDGDWSPNTWIDINTGDTQVLNSRSSLMNKISVKESTTYTYKFTHSSAKDVSGRAVYLYDKNGSFLSTTSPYSSSGTFATTSNTGYINFCVYTTSGGDLTNEDITTFILQIEEGSVATEYEPYKSTTVTCNEEVELRGVGDVKDELDLLTGELTQRINRVVLDGSERWQSSSREGYNIPIYYLRLDVSSSVVYNKNDLINNLFPVTNSSWADKEHIWIDNGVGLMIHTNLYKTLNEFKQSLSTNNLILQYPMNPTIKTVDISVVNRAGNNTKLSTFDDITYVTLSSEGLIPEAELEVATKNEEVLNTVSLEMDDISATQTALEKTSNTQSESVDATMMATTEIYEQML